MGLSTLIKRAGCNSSNSPDVQNSKASAAEPEGTESTESTDRKLRRIRAHLMVGLTALSVALTSTSAALAQTSCDAEEKGALLPDEAFAAPDRENGQEQVLESRVWWKADISSYELVEYSRSPVRIADDKQTVEETGYPSISFSVSAAEGRSAAGCAVPAHKTCAVRDISQEYYTIRTVYSDRTVSDDGFSMVCCIVNGEMGDGFSTEALKAQAVAAYTYLRYCDSMGVTPVVAYKQGYSSRIENAVRAVEGQICTYNGAPINALFCASTAGNTIGSECVWSKSMPYFKAVVSKYDYLDPNYGVKVSFTADEVRRIIESKTDIELDPADVENWFSIDSRTYGKYVGDISIGGRSVCSVGGARKRLTAAVLRSDIFGYKTLRSTAFDISYSSGVFTFTTYGFGHGVGMSQCGAELLAVKDGLKYDQLLRYYYSGTDVVCSGESAGAAERYRAFAEENGCGSSEDADLISGGESILSGTVTSDAAADTGSAADAADAADAPDGADAADVTDADINAANSTDAAYGTADAEPQEETSLKTQPEEAEGSAAESAVCA